MAACPVGAIAPDGEFNFSACCHHNYREFMGGLHRLGRAGRRQQERKRLPQAAPASPNRLDVAEPLARGELQGGLLRGGVPRRRGRDRPVSGGSRAQLSGDRRPAQDKEEPVYVVPGSDAEAYARKRWKNKTVKTVGNGLRPRSIDAMLQLLPFAFQPNQARDLRATYHFEFTGDEQRKATIVIHDGVIRVHEGHVGSADLRVTADDLSFGSAFWRGSTVWCGRCCGEKSASAVRPSSFSPSADASRAPAFAMIRRLFARWRRQGCGLARLLIVKTTPRPEKSNGRARCQHGRDHRGRAQRQNLPTRRTGGRKNSFQILARAVPDARNRAFRHSNQALLHHRILAHTPGLDRDHGKTGNERPRFTLAP